MNTDRHRQLGFACDPAGAVVLAGDRVRVRCAECGQPIDGAFVVARIFKTGAVTVFDRSAKQRHLAPARFTLSETGGG